MVEVVIPLLSLGLSVYTLFRIRDLEDRLQQSRGSALNIEKSKSSETDERLSLVIERAVKKSTTIDTATTQQPADDIFQRMWDWCSKDWQLKAGAFFILLGFVWLVTYAFVNNWVGPQGRIALGVIAGAGLLLWGDMRIAYEKNQGVILTALGAGVIAVSIASAQMIYQMFPPAVALLLLAGTSFVTSFMSLRHNVLSLAVLSSTLAYIAPILIGATDQNIMGLYGYLFAITVGSLGVARFRGWRILTFISILFVGMFSVGYFFEGNGIYTSLVPKDVLALQFFAIVFITIYFATSLITFVVNRVATRVDILTAGLIALFTYGWINGLVPTEWKSLLTAGVAPLYAGSAYVVFMKTSLKQVVFVYTAVSGILLAIATAYAFHGSTLVLAFSMEALLIPILVSLVLEPRFTVYLLLYYVLPSLLSIESITSYDWSRGIFHNAFLGLTAITASISISGYYFLEVGEEKNIKEFFTPAKILLVVGGVFAMIWVWKVSHSITLFTTVQPVVNPMNLSPMYYDNTSSYAGTMFALIIYSAGGLVAYVYGQILKRWLLNKFGLGMLLFVVARSLIVDVWSMDLPIRIITFFFIGALFMSSVLLRKKQDQPTRI